MLRGRLHIGISYTLLMVHDGTLLTSLNNRKILLVMLRGRLNVGNSYTLCSWLDATLRRIRKVVNFVWEFPRPSWSEFMMGLLSIFLDLFYFILYFKNNQKPKPLDRDGQSLAQQKSKPTIVADKTSFDAEPRTGATGSVAGCNVLKPCLDQHLRTFCIVSNASTN